jgi:hypothetical protein
MHKWWSFFWKFFGAALLAMFFAGIVAGVVKHSTALVYAITQQVLALGLGVCGIIALVVIPLDMYLEDRKLRKR